MTKLPSATALLTVEFFHLDPMSVVWNGNYLNFFEMGRRTLLGKLGYSYVEMEASGYVYPVVESHIKYIAPLRLNDQVEIKATLLEYEHWLKIGYTLTNLATGKITTKGYTKQMAVNIATNESCFVLPPIFKTQIEELIKNETC